MYCIEENFEANISQRLAARWQQHWENIALLSKNVSGKVTNDLCMYNELTHLGKKPTSGEPE